MIVESQPNLKGNPSFETPPDNCDQKDIDCEAISRLRELPQGPWRSLGRHLDYEGWSERDRFIELDRAIKLMPGSPLDFLHRKRTAAVSTRPQTATARTRRSKRIHRDMILPEVRRLSRR